MTAVDNARQVRVAQGLLAPHQTDLPGELLDQAVADALVAEHIVRGHAGLPGAQQLAEDDTARGKGQIRALVDIDGALPTQFEHRRGEVLRRLFQHQAAHRLSPGEENHVVGLFQQGGILLSSPLHNRNQAAVKGLLCQTGQKGRGGGSVSRGLEDGGVSRRQGAGKGLKRQQNGVIPGAENERDAKGHAHHARGGGKEGGRCFDALWRRQGGQPAQQEGELLQHKAGFGEIGLAFRLAKVEEKRAGNVVLMQCNGAPQCQQGLPAGRKRARGAALKVSALGADQRVWLHQNRLLKKDGSPLPFFPYGRRGKGGGGPSAAGCGQAPAGAKKRAGTTHACAFF